MRVIREQRVAPRKEVSLSVLCTWGIERGSARIVNISLSGALLEFASIRPERGAVVKVRFEPSGDAPPSELTATVVRHTETGFAVQFLAIDDALRELVEEAP